MSSATAAGKRMPIMKGVIISCNSLISLYGDLSCRHQFKYILTRRLNQDVLEHFFGVIRQMGAANENPCPLKFNHRVKNFILGKKNVLLSAKPNTVIANNPSCITGGPKRFSEASSPVKKTVAAEDIECLTATLCSFPGIFTDILEESDEEMFSVPTNEQDGLHYFLGFVVNKFKCKYPQLADDTKSTTEDYISAVNRGGLQRMAPEFIEEFMKIERAFRAFHGDSLRAGSPNLQIIVESIKASVPKVAVEVINFYLRCRTFFRVRLLNMRAHDMKLEKSRSKQKKMKKVLPQKVFK